MDVMGTTAGPADSFSTADRQVIASFASYADAERAVDHLTDASFPVEYADIVGRDLRLVERVTGRMTTRVRQPPVPVPVPGSGCSSVCSSVCSRGGRCGSD
jgi:hypothetical protein